MKLIVNNLSGIVNDSVIGNYRENTIMMKYNELKVLDKADAK